ncbi:hypothetical protein GR925_25850 [Streptomyces sp. HUCO-GS316]|uniref:hypothetical protein n=1 Tax=Streptomyces sp. HUCO-GS316 TaxID=2692198 RepID=UPI001371636B|nr:hypothetical protein [Streptomyces sp. HUCO-GS316]MXM66761.1 hypothetical protein [Streptomyces sp. HUCO-GS316]
MQFLSMTPEQREALRAHMERTADLMRRLIDGFRELARQVVPALRAFTALTSPPPAPDPLGLAYRAAAGSPPRMTAAARPAWVSPYGPAPRRH